MALEYFTSILDYKDSSKMVVICKNAQTKYNTISAGSLFSMGIKENGNMVLVTEFPNKNWTVAAKWKDLFSISCGGHVAIGLKVDGTAVAESIENNINVSDWKELTDVSAGYQYVVGLKENGTVIGAGHNGDGQYTQDWEDIIAIATGWRHTVGLDSKGNIHIVGYGSTNQKSEINENPNAWSNIIAIAAGGGIKDADGKGHTVGLREDGRVVAVGDNNFGQCNVDEWEDIVAIAAGDWHTVGLKSDGTVVIASTHEAANLFKECENWENIVAISAGTGFVLGLTEDGTVLSAGYQRQEQRPNSGNWKNIKIYDFWTNVSN